MATFSASMDAHIPYKEQLLHPLWRLKRLEILKRDGYTCKECGITADDALLHIHHRYYLKDKMAWEYENIVLITLCDACHKMEELRLEYYVKDLSDYLRHNGAMASQLEELMRYFIVVGNVETIIHALHDYWRAHILIDHLRQPSFGNSRVQTPEKPGFPF